MEAVQVELSHSGSGRQEWVFKFADTPNVSKTDQLTLIVDIEFMGAVDTRP